MRIPLKTQSVYSWKAPRDYIQNRYKYFNNLVKTRKQIEKKTKHTFYTIILYNNIKLTVYEYKMHKYMNKYNLKK